LPEFQKIFDGPDVARHDGGGTGDPIFVPEGDALYSPGRSLAQPRVPIHDEKKSPVRARQIRLVRVAALRMRLSPFFPPFGKTLRAERGI
jgi:hypothetical protein